MDRGYRRSSSARARGRGERSTYSDYPPNFMAGSLALVNWYMASRELVHGTNLKDGGVKIRKNSSNKLVIS